MQCASTHQRAAFPRATRGKKVDGYIDEIVPFFNILTYKFGLAVSRVLLNFFYKVSADHAAPSGQQDLPRDRAWRMLRMRRILVRSGDGYAILPGSRPLVSYYANSVADLLGPFATAVCARDALPAMRLLAG